MKFSPERLDASVRAMKADFPAFTVGGLPIGTGREAVWKGWVQPVRELENVELLLSDLSNNHPVRILPGGEVIHKPGCRQKHELLPWLKKLKKPDASYRLKVIYGGGPRHPRAFIIDPVTDRRTTKHTFTNGAICCYPPWENAWNWQDNTVADFMHYVVIWLIKHTVWQQVGLWLGDEMPHDTAFLFHSISPYQSCWCGSGETYGSCHRRSDKLSLLYPASSVGSFTIIPRA
jgi:hypothetical protein